jgi:hypothetical protein
MAKETERDADEAAADLALSLRAVLEGFIVGVEGANNFGRDMALLFKSEQTSAAAKVALGNNMMKMLGDFGKEEDDGLVPEAMVDRWEELQRMGNRRDSLDGMEHLNGNGHG